MKKTAVLIYDQFCYFEISIALEILTLYKKPKTIFAKHITPIKAEEGLNILPEKSISDIAIDEYDSLLLPGAADIGKVINDKEMLSFITLFTAEKVLIGAISIAPILLVKTGTLAGKPFTAGVNKADLYEEGFTEEELALMIDWDSGLKNGIPSGYIIFENIITSVSYEFVRFGIAFAKMLGIDIPPKSFGLRE